MSQAYDFNKREDFDYSHSYDYFGGMGLGRSEVEAEKMRKEKLGTYDLEPVDPPSDPAQEAESVRLAHVLHESKERDALIKRVVELKDKRMEVIWNKDHPNHKYLIWALHCLDRQIVDWQLIRRGCSGARSSSVPKDFTEPISKVQIGARVEIDNLKSRPELNHKIGTVVREEGTRWIVEFRDIQQTVSISKSNCSYTNKTLKRDPNLLPKGLKVRIMNLTSDSGKFLNGIDGYVISHNAERYTIRLDSSSELKAIKRDNLHVVLPNEWTERYDDSEGKFFFVNSNTGETSWVHPILGNVKSPEAKRSEVIRQADESESDKDESEGFERAQFLREEAKRLKLDKKHDSATVSSLKIEEALLNLRTVFNVVKGEHPFFVGFPRDLVQIITESSDEEKAKWLILGLVLLSEDLKQLKFNKKQLTCLLEKIESIIEDKSFSPEITDWIIGGLKIAIPYSHSLY